MYRRKFRWATLLLMSAGFVLAARVGLADGTQGSKSKRPDVVFITIDTLRPDHLSFYGYESETAPFLASLAKRSVIFTRAASSSSWTAPATASLFSGQYPTKHGVVEGLMATQRRQGEAPAPLRVEINRISAQTPTLPEIFRSNGYRTFGLGANPNIGPEIGFSRGFDNFERLAPIRGFTHARAEFMYRTLLDWVPEIQDPTPHFVYLHFNDPHLGTGAHSLSPIVDTSSLKIQDFDAQVLRIQNYDSQIRYLDTWLEKAFEALQVDDETIVVFVSDHGEALGEHGLGGHLCCSLHREVNQILMMWRAPALGLEAPQVDLNASIVDVLPTLLDLAGIDTKTDTDGRSLVPLLKGEAQSSDADWANRPILAHRASPDKRRESWAIIRDRYKLIDDNGSTKLYDIFADSAEVNDLSAKHPALAEQLASELAEHRQVRAAQPETVPVELSEEQQERLRALGYLRD